MVHFLPEILRVPLVSRAFSLLVVVALVAGCAGRPKGVMVPVAAAPPPAASKVGMLVATTRTPSGDPATLFAGERSAMPYFTAIDISIPPETARQSGTVQWPKRLPPNPATDFAVTKVAQIHTPTEGRQWFRQHIAGGHALVFVHGFNNTYEDSVFRLAQIVHDSKAEATPILFTWPSRAELLAYNYDKESTNYSRTALERTLRVLGDDPDVKDITILAHSMGTWLTMESLRQMGIREGHVHLKIHNVVLASPDIDIDVFAKQYVEMGSPKPKFTIFVSQDDKALAASRLISGNVLRVGAINPATEPYRSQLEQAGITAIDLTQVRTEDSLNHGKFAESPEIVQLIGKRLVTGQTLTDQDITLGDGITAVIAGTANGIGTVAAATVSAPVEIISAAGRPKAKPAEIKDTLFVDPNSEPLTN
ncbi:alpha/beta hydrolase [Rhizobium halophytocola]|uniref:Esterase/lipase superfamily enzyme n=1 Tax=Rhizobium halophytocola TaxID=735519 RepID=A0ABS4E640_9HYPH|nr:alpha/beta hydrolase [Rhizobium halophytocola]MBP1853415.1 esterase/lipase superfamily enzyme [Rhizobium halophytocola]